MELSRYTELFLAEAREHCSAVNRLLLELEKRPDHPTAVDGIFRAVHSLKGASAAMGYGAAASLAHTMESVLEPVRAGTLRVDAELVDLLLGAADALERAVECPDAAPTAPLDALLARVGGTSPPQLREVRATPPDETTVAAAATRAVRVRVSVAGAMLPAARAVIALRNVRALGGVREVDPPEAAIEAGELGDRFSFVLDTDVEDDQVRQAVVAAGEVVSVEIDDLTPVRAAEVLARSEPVVRVKQSRLDALLDQVGELVVARDRLRRASAGSDAPELDEVVDSVSALVGSLRDEILRLRMVPVDEVFDRFPRVVRDAARALGKRVELELAGRHEEVDRGLLNECADLLVHLLRNAVDHGIELPEERRAAGKREVGRISLTAVRDASVVEFRVEDDGRGLQRDRIVRVAVARGLVDARKAGRLSETEIDSLILRAGLSTAERVTDVSGRGVGMDVVLSRVEAMGGTIEIRSRAGEGTLFTIRLPLSLSIVRSLRVGAAGQNYLVPVASIVEVAEVEHPELSRRGADLFVRLRDATLPAIDVSALFGSGSAGRREGLVPLVVVSGGGTRVALLVDALHGQQEAVAKPFDATLGVIDVFSGAALMADGRPALILDPLRLAGRLRPAVSAVA